MTGAEQTTVNELAGLVRGIDARVAGMDARVASMDDRIANIESGLRRLEDDKVARDAVASAHTDQRRIFDARIAIIVGVVAMAANVVVRIVFGA